MVLAEYEHHWVIMADFIRRTMGAMPCVSKSRLTQRLAELRQMFEEDPEDFVSMNIEEILLGGLRTRALHPTAWRDACVIAFEVIQDRNLVLRASFTQHDRIAGALVERFRAAKIEGFLFSDDAGGAGMRSAAGRPFGMVLERTVVCTKKAEKESGFAAWISEESTCLRSKNSICSQMSWR